MDIDGNVMDRPGAPQPVIAATPAGMTVDASTFVRAEYLDAYLDVHDRTRSDRVAALRSYDQRYTRSKFRRDDDNRIDSARAVPAVDLRRGQR